jgi:hypothetical protein
VLDDLVDPDEVDEYLRDEIKEECDKYGIVLNCVVHHLQGRDTYKIRVYVEYQNV